MPTETHNSKQLLGIALMFIGLALYPISDACIKYLLGSYSVHQTTCMRAFTRLIPLLIIAYFRKGSFLLLKTTQPYPHLIRLIVSIIGTYSFIYACSRTSLASMYTLSYTSPIFMLLLSSFVLKEKVNLYRWLAVGIGFIGVVTALHPAGGDFFQIGSFVVLVGTVCAALNKILMRKLSIIDDPLTIAIYPNIATLLLTGPFLFSSWTPMTYNHWALFGAIGLIAALAQYSIAQALTYTEASKLAPIDYSTLFWAIGIDYFHWNALPSGSTIMGASIIIASNFYIFKSSSKNGTDS